MKELSQFINLELLKSLRIYILGIIIPGTVLFVKGLMQGDRDALKKVTRASNEAIHLKQTMEGQGLLSHIKVGIHYSLYGFSCLLRQAEPIVITGGSALIIYYLKKKPELITSFIPLKKIPIEFHELIPLVPATMVGVFSSFSCNIFQSFYSLLPSKYSLLTNFIPKTEETKTKQVKVTNIIQEIGSDIRTSGVNCNKETQQPNIPSQGGQFTPSLYNALEAEVR